MHWKRVALAGGGVETDVARASEGGGALTLASVLAVNLRACARGDDEGARGSGVGETAEAGGKGRALASNRIECGAAGAGLYAWASTRARSLAVSLGQVASGDDEGAGGRIVHQAARVSGVGRAGASGVVEGGTAEASSDCGALASASSLAVGLET